MLDDTIHNTKDEDKQTKKHNTICVGRHHRQYKGGRQKTQHNMCWTPPHTRPKTKTNKTKNTTQYVLDDTIHKKKDEDKQTKKHNTICVGRHHTQDKRRRQTNQKTQHNMCWTPPHTRPKTKTNKPKNTTQYVLYTTMHQKTHTHNTKTCTRQKTKNNKTNNATQYVLDTTTHKKKNEDKQTKKHNTICV